MVRRLLLVAALTAVPLAARAEPRSADAAQTPVTYAVPQPGGHARPGEGWGLYATMSGRSMDLGDRDFEWSEDPRVQPHDVEAGYGWRSGAASAVLGYQEHDFGPKYATTAQERQDLDVHRVRGSGVLGLSLVLHGQ
jgi:hypothetical protein